MANVVYNRMIRKITVAFGELFSNITLVRYNPDQTEQERFVVPIDYATKELYVMRIQGDPNLDKKVQMTLPRMSYEMNGLTYDSTRKQNTNIQNFAKNNGAILSQYMPVPYDFDFSLYLYVRNIEDGNQIIEHILPFFAPDYTIKVNMIPEMGIVKEVPVILNDVKYDVTYEGDRDSDTRMVIWTLNFTAKGFVFGANTSANLIKTSITNIYNEISTEQNIKFNMNTGGSGDYIVGESVYQGVSPTLSTASATVVAWDFDKVLTVSNMNGNFLSNTALIGQNSNANWSFYGYNLVPQQMARIIVVPEPTDANGNVSYTYSTDIKETIDIHAFTTNTNFAGDMTTEIGVDDLNKEQENITDLSQGT